MKGGQHCIFCDPSALEKELDSIGGSTGLIRRLAVPGSQVVRVVLEVGSSDAKPVVGRTQVFWLKDETVFHAALARIGEVSPDVADYEDAAKNCDLEEVPLPGRPTRKRPAAAPPLPGRDQASESDPCTAATDRP